MKIWRDSSLRSHRMLRHDRGHIRSALGWLALSVLVVLASRLVGLGALKRGSYRELLRWYADVHPRQWASTSLLHGSWTPLFVDVLTCWVLALGLRKLQRAFDCATCFLREALGGARETLGLPLGGFESAPAPVPLRTADPERLWVPRAPGVRGNPYPLML